MGPSCSGQPDQRQFKLPVVMKDMKSGRLAVYLKEDVGRVAKLDSVSAVLYILLWC